MAISLDPSAGIAYNNLCWYGSLLGDPAKVLSVCEKAVSLEPNNPHCRDSRALARALTGDYKGAILDFQFFVSQAGTDPSIKPADVSIRTQWISSLKKGINPFDPAELQKLLGNNGLKPDAPQRDVWNSNKLSYAVLPRRHQDTEIFSLFSLRCSASPWPKKPRLA